jgi:cation transport regulator
MNTPEKEKLLTKESINKAVFVRAMAEMMMTLTSDQIKIPTKYREQVIVVKDILKNDASGLVNALLDFAITASMVSFSIETDNQDLTALFTEWLEDLNSDLRGQIPTGIEALAKEYLRERWKGSSFLLMRTIWEDKNGFILPTKLWFVNGEDITIDNGNNDASIIGQEKYSLKVGNNKYKSLPSNKNEILYVQKPYESWGTTYPVPFLIRRGLYRNMRLMDMIASKSEYIIGKALEYLLLLKKGTEQTALANQAEFIYSQDDLAKIKKQMEELIADRKTIPGTPTYATNFDTEIQHLIPDYSMALKQELYAPIERRLLSGLGLVDILQGVASTRRESTLNPRPFISEVQSGIDGFKMMLTDILYTIVELNKDKHPKHVGSIQKVHNSPIEAFMTKDMEEHFKNLYDRGLISKRTYAEMTSDIDFDIEITRREHEEEVVDVMYPPVIINNEKDPNDPGGTLKPEAPYKKEPKVPKEEAKVYEEAPYKTVDDLPSNVTNVLPKEAQRLWMRVFNESFPKGEDYARKVAWTVVKRIYKKSGDKWVQKKKVKGADGNFLDLSTASVDDLLKIQELELKNIQLELAKKLLKNDEEQ